MGLHRVFGPGRDPFETPEHWICLACGEESTESDFIQCEKGVNINDTLKSALATICCSEPLIERLIKKTKSPPKPPNPNKTSGSKIGQTIDITNDLWLPTKRSIDVFFDDADYTSGIQLLVMAENDKHKREISNEDILTLLKIFKPLLTNSAVTLFHESTRICDACCRKIRRENYKGGEKIPEIICPVCESVMG